LLVTQSSLHSSPTRPSSVLASVALPVLDTVTVLIGLAVISVWLLNATEAGETAIDGAVVVPNPVSVTVCGELVALPLTINVAVRAPRADGVNVMLRPHELPGGTFWPAQVLATLKSPALTPTTVTPVTVNPESPTLSTLTVC